jgi:hypothetical protein
MRTKTIIDGFKNSQKFRVIFKGDGSENEIGMYLTIKQMSEQFATVNARATCWDAMIKLSYLRYEAKRKNETVPTGLNHTFRNTEVQVTLM